MGVLKKLLGIVGVVIVLFVATSFFIPKEYSVERRITIDAQPAEVYPYIVDLREWQKWGVWFKRDPQMELDYSGPDRAIGMRSEWKSDTEGDGEMEITQLEHNKRVLYRLYFPEFDMGSTGTVEMKEVAEGSYDLSGVALARAERSEAFSTRQVAGKRDEQTERFKELMARIGVTTGWPPMG